VVVMKADDELLSAFLAEAKADEVGPWLIIATLRNELGIADPALIRAMTLDYARRLLESGEVVANWYTADGITQSNMSIPEIVSRIDWQWDELGREPNIGDIVVFRGR